MARIRSIKPEVRKSETVAAWPREVRLAWVYLWGYLDDYGRGKDDMRLIVAECFPLDRDITERKMERWVELMATPSELADEGELPPLCRYEVGKRRFLHATKWADHQRVSHPQASRIPSCPIHESKDGAA